jgi:hydrogenase-4 component F
MNPLDVFLQVALWAALAVPLAAATAALLRPGHPGARFTALTSAVVILAAGLALTAATTTTGDSVESRGFTEGLLRADALAAYLLAVVGLIATVAIGGAWSDDRGGRFNGLMCLFLTAMALATLADNLGVLWVAIEGTTIASAFMVAHGGGRHALEAAWKYVVLGSVGVAIAFLGLVLLYAAGAGLDPTLSWSGLMTRTDLDPSAARIGVALTALGLATKAGLAPMHSWLPDAHSQAPAQVSGLMSGVLLSVAFVGILRVKAVSDHLLGPDLMRTLLVIAGLLSLAVAAALMITQRDYKRLLAYSSIEHMGIIAVGAAIGGPLATAAVLLHILGHGLAKASLFVVVGRILKATGTSAIANVRGLLVSDPSIARPWLAGVGALAGLPPGVLFFTETALVVAGFQADMPLISLALLALLLVAFAALAKHTLFMSMATSMAGSTAGSMAGSTAGSMAGSTAWSMAGSSPQSSAAKQPEPDATTRRERGVTTMALVVVAALPLFASPLRAVLTAATAALAGVR